MICLILSIISILSSNSDWLHYYEWKSRHNRPSFLIEKSVQSFQEDGKDPTRAMDIGCGAGHDSAFLAKKGWKVIAIDVEKIAGDYLDKKLSSENKENVQFIQTNFENYLFAERVDLVHASYALSFCSPGSIDDLMKRITNAIAPGGRFSGNFFGTRHFESANTNMTFLTKEEILGYFSESFTIEYFEEDEGEKNTITEPEHFHTYFIIAKRL